MSPRSRIHFVTRTHPLLKSVQSKLVEQDFVNGISGAEPLVSIVKGMTFFLIQVNSEDTLARYHSYPESLSVPEVGDWASFIGIYVFYEREDGVISTRMFDGSLEDPATGSAASTLGGYLATKRGEGTHNINILQGVEMGRKSEIELVVEVGKNAEVLKVQLGGGAVEVMQGTVFYA